MDVVQQEWERAYGRVQKQARLPGFRKGHVPRSLVKVHFSDDVRREVAEHLIPDVYRKALTEANLEPVNEPDLQEVKLEEGAPLSFVAVVEVKPAISLGDYKGVEVQHAPVPVTTDDLSAALEAHEERAPVAGHRGTAREDGDEVVSEPAAEQRRDGALGDVEDRNADPELEAEGAPDVRRPRVSAPERPDVHACEHPR